MRIRNRSMPHYKGVNCNGLWGFGVRVLSGGGEVTQEWINAPPALAHLSSTTPWSTRTLPTHRHPPIPPCIFYQWISSTSRGVETRGGFPCGISQKPAGGDPRITFDPCTTVTARVRMMILLSLTHPRLVLVSTPAPRSTYKPTGHTSCCRIIGSRAYQHIGR